ncbi:hypothetical protein LUZ60_008638 [Juncus effusus]|nr:hypothetical protein LUZ60_008638 [Juncus effusus]
MEGNKDDAAKCLRIAKEALQSGDRARALKFLSKAGRLDPSLPIDDLISAASGDGDPAQDDSSTAPPDAPSPSSSSSSSATGARARPRATRVSPSDAAAGSNTNANSASASASYTEEQVEIVREVKRKQKDYYLILGVEKSCTVEDVRKAYRKLSLKVHPDKNKAPGAEDAFKAVSKAFQCLSNEEARKRYDLVGSDEPVAHRRSSHARHGGYDGFYEGDFDADEIFRNFFFGGMAPARTAQFGSFHFQTGGMGMNRGPAVQHASGNNTIRLLIQILPVIILLLLNFLPSSEPVYVLSRGYPYDQKMQTARGNVPYYVRSGKYEEEYPYGSAQREALERSIEREYVGVVSQNCRLEFQRKQWGLSYQTPHCDLLNKYEQAVAAASA